MNLRIIARSILATLMDFSGQIDNAITNKSNTDYLILMYHRIIPFGKAEPGLQEGMYVEPETFNMHIQYFKNKFSVVPLSKVPSFTNDVDIKINEKPICVLTFDDGWLDFYKYAYPILLENNIPATVFLPTKYIGTKNRFWTDIIAGYCINVIKNRDVNSNSSNMVINELNNINGDVNQKIEKAISLLKDFPEDRIVEIINEISGMPGFDRDRDERVFLNWDEAREMFASKLITFGSHTDSHRILVHLTNDEIEEELMTSKSRLLSERVANPSFIPFCYPNGNLDENIVRKVADAGYHVATTTRNGWNHPKSSNYDLNRVALHQDMSSGIEMLKCRIAGIY